jgi:hypothetical protein
VLRIISCGKTFLSKFDSSLNFTKEIWRYSNIKCCTYPLRGIDTIADGGRIGLLIMITIFIFISISDRNSSLMSIVSGKTENHLDMLDNMVIERLLNDKWSSFARVNKLN